MTIKLAKRMHDESVYAGKSFDEAAVWQFLKCIDDKHVGMYMADHTNHGIIGFAAANVLPCMHSFEKIGQGIVMYVVPGHRHTLAFAGLLRTTENWTKKQGATCFLGGISASADPMRASRAYKKLGYVETGIMLRKDFV
jgi:GNAT superfamily N-acetyltransferase